MTMLTDADRTLLQRIILTDNPLDKNRLIRAYYQDLDRAERTPREMLYLHMGMLTGIVANFTEKQ